MSKSTALEAGHVAPAPGQRTGPIDMVHLDQQSLGDAGLREEVLRLYADMSQVYLSRVEASTTVPELLASLHTLKSAASGIGAWGVRDLARTIEEQLRAGAAVSPEWVDDIAMAVAECNAFIEKIIADPVD